MDFSMPGFSVHGVFRQEYLSGLSFLLHGIFPNQGSNPRLQHLLHQEDSLWPCYLGSPKTWRRSLVMGVRRKRRWRKGLGVKSPRSECPQSHLWDWAFENRGTWSAGAPGPVTYGPSSEPTVPSKLLLHPIGFKYTFTSPGASFTHPTLLLLSDSS